MIDSKGYRPNVGIILFNGSGQVLWAKRKGQDGWQFPQGGINMRETPRQALFRELHEEVGLNKNDVQVLACTRGWLRYRLPPEYVRTGAQPVCLGQKQKWFLLRFCGDERQVCLTNSAKPEFEAWRWVSYWYPVNQVVPFKKVVYTKALKELAQSLPAM